MTRPDIAKFKVINEDWKLKSRLGAGSFGEVHLATEIKSGIKVAIKFDLKPEGEDKAFKKEVDFLTKLNDNSQHVPTLIAFGKFNSINYCVMQLLGSSLSDLRRDQPHNRFSVSSVLRITRQMVWAARDVQKVYHVMTKQDFL